MMTSTTLQELIKQLEKFGKDLVKLSQMMVDLNETNAPHLIEEIHAETLAIVGLQVSALDAAGKTQLSIDQNNGLENTSRLLAACNQSFKELFAKFYERLYTTETILELDKLRRRRAGQWVTITMNDLNARHKEIQELSGLLLNCWQSLAEIAVIGTPSLHSTSIGQQFLFSERSS
jgi:hypothetical protein